MDAGIDAYLSSTVIMLDKVSIVKCTPDGSSSPIYSGSATFTVTVFSPRWN